MEIKTPFFGSASQPQQITTENMFPELLKIIPSKKEEILKIVEILAYEEKLLKTTLSYSLREYLTTELAQLTEMAPKIIKLIATIKGLDDKKINDQERVNKIKQNLAKAITDIYSSLLKSREFIASQTVTSDDYAGYGLS